jgi:hypothetical protein
VAGEEKIHTCNGAVGRPEMPRIRPVAPCLGELWNTLQPVNNKGQKEGRPTDQDALQYLTDRANKANLELLCFGNTLFLYEPGDKQRATIHYGYRRGLISFEPTFNGTGKPTKVTVMGRNPDTGEDFGVTVTSAELAAAGLIPPLEGEGTALDKVENSGQGGERVEVVTNYRAVTPTKQSASPSAS